MKKWLSFVLALALLCGLAAPAGAQGESTDARLAQVTVKVKETLGIGDEYESFYGELWENELAPTWSLNWEGDGVRLSVEATEEGKVLRYDLYREDASSGEAAPAFPAVSRAKAREKAEAFLNAVLEKPLESASFDEGNTGSLDTTSHRFSGNILLNGVPSPLSFSVTVGAEDGTVIRFSRDSMEGTCIGGVPSSKPAAAAGAAGALLKGTLSLRLEYVLNEDGTTASLRYLPEPTDEFYVDASTGKLVNLTELYEKVYQSENGLGTGAAGGDSASSAESAADAGLTDAELAGIAQMEGVLSKEELDGAARKVSELGLSAYTLASVSYRLDQETGDVTASLTYSRRDESGMWRRAVDLDGRTGTLLAVSSSAPYAEKRTAKVSEEKARQIAEAFLTSLWGEAYGESALYDSSPWMAESYWAAHSFTYAQQANGYFLPANALRVSVDITDGSISSLSREWTDGVAFDDPAGIVDEAAAMNAWFGHYDVALAYRLVPVKLDPSSPGAAPLMEMGYSYFYSLVLSYALEEDGYASGVDAKTGEVIIPERTEPAGIAYSDLEGHWVADRAQALAAYGIGWTGGLFRPDETLTQLDLVALLASTQGYRYDPKTGSADDLYRYAYSMGILTRAERSDGAPVTRGQVVKCLLDSAGCGAVAALKGIYTCAYPDADQIPDSLYGYAALAQGMGVVDSTGPFAAGRAATRAEAAAMLYNFMNR